MLNFGTTYPIGIDIHDQRIYAVQLKEDRKGIALRGLAKVRVEGGIGKATDNGDEVIAQLKTIAKNKAFRGKRVVIHLPSQFIYSFPLNIEVDQGDSVEAAIVQEAGKHLSFPIEDASIDYPAIETVPSGKVPKHKATVIATNMEHMRQMVLWLQQAGLTVEAVDASISSMIRLHHYLYKSDAGPVILCHVGYKQTLLAIVTEDRILVHHSVPWGIEILLDQLQENLELSREKALVYLKEYGLPYENRQNSQGPDSRTEGDETLENMVKEISQIITPYLEALIHEFHNVIGYVISAEADARSEAIFLYGHANFVRNLDDCLAGTLNIPTTLVNPMTNFTLPEENAFCGVSEAAPFSLALGLAMRKVPWL